MKTIKKENTRINNRPFLHLTLNKLGKWEQKTEFHCKLDDKVYMQLKSSIEFF